MDSQQARAMVGKVWQACEEIEPKGAGGEHNVLQGKHGSLTHCRLVPVAKENVVRWQEDSAHNMPNSCQAIDRTILPRFWGWPCFAGPLVLKPLRQESSCTSSFTFSGLRLRRLASVTPVNMNNPAAHSHYCRNGCPGSVLQM
jgi:hypothetical protein